MIEETNSRVISAKVSDLRSRIGSVSTNKPTPGQRSAKANIAIDGR